MKKKLFKRSYQPTWRITYSFNPPDDDSPDNLIRTVKTHVKPDVKEGDLIPILYLIHKGLLNKSSAKSLGLSKEDAKNKEFVYSSPYPIPACDEFKPSLD